ncbi:MAG: type II toxin-antitoxin system prevent-host-death family antitoxin [Thermodesulfovibrionales bacterium]
MEVKMISVGIKELKTKLSRYVDMVRHSEEIVITEHSKEVALVIPISRERKAVKSLINSGKAKWSGGKPGGLDYVKIKGRSLSETVLEDRRCRRFKWEKWYLSSNVHRKVITLKHSSIKL